MNFLNFRTMILCCVCWLCTYSISANAQDIEIPGEVIIDLSSFSSVADSTGEALDAVLDDDTDPDFDGRVFFEATQDGVTTSNTLIAPLAFDVVEFPGLQLTIEDAAALTGIDSSDGDNRAFFNVSGTGLGIGGPQQRANPLQEVGSFNAIESNSNRLDFSNEEFITISFNQDVIVFGLGVTNFDDGETFTFGSAADLTNENVIEDVLGLNSFTGVPNVDLLTFPTPLEIAAGELILVGNTGFDPAVLSGATAGVGFEQILLTVIPAIPEPSSLAVLGLGSLLIAARRRR